MDSTTCTQTFQLQVRKPSKPITSSFKSDDLVNYSLNIGRFGSADFAKYEFTVISPKDVIKAEEPSPKRPTFEISAGSSEIGKSDR